mmetsp:Transcript_105949/g.284805  ORF Transcript_105949/g.284805 Transcript_105949/m.284805 type:complete len:247 (+) Transcript_105949:1034-1774(+)
MVSISRYHHIPRRRSDLRQIGRSGAPRRREARRGGILERRDPLHRQPSLPQPWPPWQGHRPGGGGDGFWVLHEAVGFRRGGLRDAGGRQDPRGGREGRQDQDAQRVGARGRQPRGGGSQAGEAGRGVVPGGPGRQRAVLAPRPRAAREPDVLRAARVPPGPTVQHGAEVQDARAARRCSGHGLPGPERALLCRRGHGEGERSGLRDRGHLGHSAAERLRGLPDGMLLDGAAVSGDAAARQAPVHLP